MTKAKPDNRTPEQTRRHLLEIAYDEIYRHGYQGLRVNSVLDKAGLTKGAIYHYFPSKQALGYAVVDEVIAGHIQEIWIDTLAECDDPAVAISTALGKAWATKGIDMLKFGCPLNNLAQEMSPIDAGFRDRTRKIFRRWREAFVEALERGKTAGVLRKDVDSEAAATYVLGSLEGCIGIAKNEGDASFVSQCAGQLERYLNSLRAPKASARRT
ncbi:MAG: TetR/AcrR family transcriptional regulator [Hyphomicrobiales bacterium]|nr:TetR/AcrR family transcriptional regulator [Hyphomicrobiales bacterium]